MDSHTEDLLRRSQLERARKAQEAVNELGAGPKCQVTQTIKEAPFHGRTLLFRCDREAQHEGMHHGSQPNGEEMYWGLNPEQIAAALPPKTPASGECDWCGEAHFTNDCPKAAWASTQKHANGEDGHNFCAKCAGTAW